MESILITPQTTETSHTASASLANCLDAHDDGCTLATAHGTVEPFPAGDAKTAKTDTPEALIVAHARGAVAGRGPRGAKYKKPMNGYSGLIRLRDPFVCNKKINDAQAREPPP